MGHLHLAHSGSEDDGTFHKSYMGKNGLEWEHNATYVNIHIFMYTSTYIYMYIYTQIDIHIYIYIANRV